MLGDWLGRFDESSERLVVLCNSRAHLFAMTCWVIAGGAFLMVVGPTLLIGLEEKGTFDAVVIASLVCVFATLIGQAILRGGARKWIDREAGVVGGENQEVSFEDIEWWEAETTVGYSRGGPNSSGTWYRDWELRFATVPDPAEEDKQAIAELSNTRRALRWFDRVARQLDATVAIERKLDERADSEAIANYVERPSETALRVSSEAYRDGVAGRCSPQNLEDSERANRIFEQEDNGPIGFDIRRFDGGRISLAWMVDRWQLLYTGVFLAFGALIGFPAIAVIESGNLDPVHGTIAFILAGLVFGFFTLAWFGSDHGDYRLEVGPWIDFEAPGEDSRRVSAEEIGAIIPLAYAEVPTGIWFLNADEPIWCPIEDDREVLPLADACRNVWNDSHW